MHLFLYVRDAGAVAQLVEHYVRNVGVVSSNLIRSTSFSDGDDSILPCSRPGESPVDTETPCVQEANRGSKEWERRYGMSLV